MIKWKSGGSPYFDIGQYRFSFRNLKGNEPEDAWKWVIITGEPIMSYMKGKKGKSPIAAGKDTPRTTIKATTFTSKEGGKNVGPAKDMFGGDAKLRTDMKKVFVKWGKKTKDEYIHKEELKGLHDDIEKILKKHGASNESIEDKIDFILGE